MDLRDIADALLQFAHEVERLTGKPLERIALEPAIIQHIKGARTDGAMYRCDYLGRDRFSLVGVEIEPLQRRALSEDR